MRIQPAFTDREVAFDLSLHGHAFVTLYVQFFRSDWSKVDRWVHVENLCSILPFETCLLIAETDSVLCNVAKLLTVFFYWMHKIKQLLARFLSYSWLVCILVFGWEMRRLSKSSEIRFLLHFPLLNAYYKGETIFHGRRGRVSFRRSINKSAVVWQNEKRIPVKWLIFLSELPVDS